jgi:uncharacterized protein
MNKRLLRKLDITLLTDYTVQWLSHVALAIISLYQAVLSPVLLSMWGPACRFEPTCSAYAAQAIAHYGISRGAWMALKRFMKCRPFSGWGFDPVPACCPDRINMAGTEARQDKRNCVG